MGKGKKKGGIPISGASAAVAAPKASVDVYSGLNRDEIQFLSKVTRDFGDVRGNSASHGKGNTSTTSHHAFVAEAERILEEHNMIIIENILTPLEVDTLHGEYIALHENQGTQQAIGEKDASKRSGTLIRIIWIGVSLESLEGYSSVLLVSYIMWSGASESLDLLLSHPTITLAYHISIILISALKHCIIITTGTAESMDPVQAKYETK